MLLCKPHSMTLASNFWWGIEARCHCNSIV
jgi:hypothetical protein